MKQILRFHDRWSGFWKHSGSPAFWLEMVETKSVHKGHDFDTRSRNDVDQSNGLFFIDML